MGYNYVISRDIWYIISVLKMPSERAPSKLSENQKLKSGHQNMSYSCPKTAYSTCSSCRSQRQVYYLLIALTCVLASALISLFLYTAESLGRAVSDGVIR